MSDDEIRRDDPTDPAEVRALVQRAVDSSDVSIKNATLVLLGEMIATGQPAVRLTVEQIGTSLRRSRRHVQGLLARVEAQIGFVRHRRNGRPIIGEQHGDIFSLPQLVGGRLPLAPPGSGLAAGPPPSAIREETQPARAGPTRERPEGAANSPEAQGGTGDPDRSTEPGNTDQP